MIIGIRRVPENWIHPKDAQGRFILLRDGCFFNKALKKWDEKAKKWDEGLVLHSKSNGKFVPKTPALIAANLSKEKWYGHRPKQSSYMPVWSKEEKTHYQVYNYYPDGTPISPVMKTLEDIINWLVANEFDDGLDKIKPSFSSGQWLFLIKNGGFAPGLGTFVGLNASEE